MDISNDFIKTGESASLYNCTLSPGWTIGETEILRLALMKFGIGRWTEICSSNCLPGKTPSQCNLQAQRLLGQQSTAEFMVSNRLSVGLHLDPNVIREENNKKYSSLSINPRFQIVNVIRKNGFIVNCGNKLKREDIRRMKKLIKLEFQLEKTIKEVSSCSPNTSDFDSAEETLQDSTSDFDVQFDLETTEKKIQSKKEYFKNLIEKRVELRKNIQFEIDRNKNKKKTLKVKANTHKREKTTRKRTKQSNSETDEEVKMYPCICNQRIQKEDFWIACDQCDEWFHGLCVGVLKEDADTCPWLCQLCSLKEKDNPDLLDDRLQ